MPSGKKKAKREDRPFPVFDPNPSAKFASELLFSEGIPFALIGRIAMWTVLPAEQHEFTKDIDFAVPLAARKQIGEALRQRNLHPRQLPIGGWAVRTDDLRVDFIDRSEGGLNLLYDEAIAAARQSKHAVPLAGQQIPVVPLEYLVALKVVAADPKDQRDVIRLLTARPETDLVQTRDIVLRHGGPGSANLLDALARQAHHPNARPAYRNGG